MKYIIDVPGEQDVTYDTKHKVFLAVSEGIASVEVGIDAEPYTELDRKAIEDEVWELANNIYEMSLQDKMSCFGFSLTPAITSNLSCQEAKSKFEAWKKQNDEIKIGEEIVGIYSNGEITPPLVVLKVEGDYYYGIYSKTGDFTQGGLNYEKTGRYFPEVAELLKKMKNR